MSTTTRRSAAFLSSLLLAASLLGLVASPAEAADQSFTDSVPVQDTNWMSTVNIPQFDPANGTLLSVEVAVTGSLAGSSAVENISTSSGTTATLNLAAMVQLDADPGGGTALIITNPVDTQTATLDIFDGTIDFGGPSGATFDPQSDTDSASQTYTDAATLAAYTGTGTLTLDAEASAMSSATGGGNLVVQFNTDAGLEVTVTYTFEPPPMPAIEIEKSPDSQTVVSGSDVTFTITVTNTGDVDLVNVVVTDALAPACDNVIGALAVGASVSYDCTVTNVTADFVNVATVTGEDSQGNQVSDEDDAEVLVLVPGIEIEKSPDSQTVVSGSDVTFTITVTNTGDVDLVNVVVTDALAPACDNVIGALAVGASVSYDCTVTNVTADFVNVATVTGEDSQGNQVSDEDDAEVLVLVPGIEIEKSPDSQTVVSGSDVTFTITVTNTGDVDLVNVVVTDALAPACDNVIGALAVGASVSYDCTVTNVTADFVNVATVTGEDSQGNQVSDEDDAEVLVLVPGIEIEKSPDSQTVVSGSDVTFTITVTNTGDVDLVNVVVTDALAPACDNVIGALAVGASVSYDCTVTNVTADFVNVATVTGEDSQGNQVSDEDDAEVVVLVPGIDIQKTPDAQTVPVGSDVTFTITVTNTGQVDLVNVTVTDVVAPACDNVIGALAVGESVSYDCTLPAVDAPVTNVATVTGEDSQGNEVSDEDDAQVEVAAIQVVKVADQQEVEVGDTILYTYTVTNIGSVTLTDIMVEDDVLGPITLEKTTLEPGESTTGTAVKVVTEADLPGPAENLAFAEGVFDNPAGEPGKVSDEDDESVDITQPPVVAPTTVATLPATGLSSDKFGRVGVVLVLLGIALVLAATGVASARLQSESGTPGLRMRLAPSTVGKRLARTGHRIAERWHRYKGRTAFRRLK